MGLVKNLALMAYISVGCSLSPILVSTGEHDTELCVCVYLFASRASFLLCVSGGPSLLYFLCLWNLLFSV